MSKEGWAEAQHCPSIDAMLPNSPLQGTLTTFALLRGMVLDAIRAFWQEW